MFKIIFCQKKMLILKFSYGFILSSGMVDFLLQFRIVWFGLDHPQQDPSGFGPAFFFCSEVRK